MMFKFLEKNENEYEKFNGFLLKGNKRITEKPLKTFLWLPTKTSDKAHLYLYIDNRDVFKQIKCYIRDNRLNFEGDKSDLGGNVQEKIYIKELYIENYHATSIAKDWFMCIIKINFFKHLVNLCCIDDEKQSNELIFYITDSIFLKSHYFTTEKYNGEVKIENKEDIVLDNLKHLGINKIQIDTSLKYNSVKIDFLHPCRSFLQYFKINFPILEYFLAITSFAERRNIYSFKMYGEINNKRLEYYQGNKTFRTTQRNDYELIDKGKIKDFLENSLKKEFDEIKKISKFFIRFNIINRADNTVENKITGMIYLLEKYIRYKRRDPDCKMKFLKENEIYIDDLINIKIIKNVKNCIAHGYDDLPPRDLLLILENLEILMERLLLNELNWNFSNSRVSVPYLKLNYKYYEKKELLAKNKRKCLK